MNVQKIIPARFQQQPHQVGGEVVQPPAQPRHAKALDFMDHHAKLEEEAADLRDKLETAIVEIASLSQRNDLLKGEVDALRRERASLAQVACELKVQLGVVASQAIAASNQAKAAVEAVAEGSVRALEAAHREMVRAGLAMVVAGPEDGAKANDAGALAAVEAGLTESRQDGLKEEDRLA